MEPVIISWTPTNWATVFLMVLGGFLVLKVAVIILKKVTAGNANA